MDQLPFVSIVIPVRNRAELLRTCLRSIEELDYPRERYEVIVADGGSTDETFDVARSHGVTVVHNLGKTEIEGRSAGASRARGEIVAYCDSDCVLHRDWLKAAVPYFNDPTVGGVGGPIFAPIQGTFAQSVHLFFQFAVITANAAHSSRPGPVRATHHVPTCNFIVRTSALGRVLPIAWPIVAGCDLEMTRRIRSMGFKLLLTPDVCVWHYNRTSPRTFFLQLLHYGIANAYIGRDDRSMTRLPHVLAGLALPLMIAALTVVAFRPALLPWCAGAIGAALIGYGAWAYARSRSFAIAACAVPTLVMGITAWSIGFLFECVRSSFPWRGRTRALPREASSP